MKKVKITLLNHDDDMIYSTWYRIKALTNSDALIEAINLFVKQVTESKRNYEILSASIEED